MKSRNASDLPNWELVWLRHRNEVLLPAPEDDAALEARQQLANLITYMDGKGGAEELVGKLLQDPALLQTLAKTKKPEGEAQS